MRLRIRCAVFLAFEKCAALREDLTKAEKKAQVEAATRALLEYGEPPGDNDELMSLMGAGACVALTADRKCEVFLFFHFITRLPRLQVSVLSFNVNTRILHPPCLQAACTARPCHRAPRGSPATSRPASTAHCSPLRESGRACCLRTGGRLRAAPVPVVEEEGEGA